MEKIMLIVTGFVFHNNTFLFVKRADNDTFLPGFWEMPGGKTDFGEDLKKGVIREVKEECGIDIVPEYILTSRNYLHETDPHMQFVEIFYLAKMADNTQSVQLSEEHSAFQWVTLEEAKKMHATPYIIGVLEEIFIHPLLHH